MSEPTKAVFLSYAREDADVARRIAEALRAFGVDAWFDQADLRGGDAWDVKIKKQIRECALFLPIISAHTQERSEGYFRREWLLAVERTRDMAAGRAFVMPVVIDDTPEAGAAVPDEFMRFQWTRLENGEPTPEFIAQVKQLLQAPKKPALKAELPRPPTLPPGFRQAAPARVETGAAAAPASRAGIPGKMWGMLAAVLVVVVTGVFALRRTNPVVPPVPIITAVLPASVPATMAPNAKSIAVLPFANLSTEKENEFFADGVHDDVITHLAKIRDLKVISRTSVLAYRDPAARNLKKIAAELGVTTVLEGSIRRVGTRVHMNAQLIDARTDEHLWADTFDGDTGDIFALQASLAQKIAAALKATLTPGERALIARRPTENPEAYALYLRARTLHQEQGERGTPADFERVVAAYESAIAMDPTFALAHAQVAFVHSVMYWFGFLDPTPARAQKMKAAVDAAVRLAPDAPETHLALGAYLYRVQRDWPRALAEFKLAEAALPNDAQLFFWLAITNRRLGHWTESIGYFAHSAELNPRDLAPVSNYIGFLATLRRWDEASAATTRFLIYFPNERDLLDLQAQIAFAISGDRAGYARALAALPSASADPAGAVDRYRSAFWLGDYAAADRVLVESRLATITETSAQVINDPVQFSRALLAALRGDAAAARNLSDQAIEFYRHQRWNSRQQAWVDMRLAQAAGLAGRTDEAIRAGQAALASMVQQDIFDARALREMLGEIYVLAGRRTEAMDVVRELMNGPCVFSANEIRFHPVWSLLKDDPRFEEILRSAKPL